MNAEGSAENLEELGTEIMKIQKDKLIILHRIIEKRQHSPNSSFKRGLKLVLKWRSDAPILEVVWANVQDRHWGTERASNYRNTLSSQYTKHSC
jgi:hypothetical protein